MKPRPKSSLTFESVGVARAVLRVKASDSPGTKAKSTEVELAQLKIVEHDSNCSFAVTDHNEQIAIGDDLDPLSSCCQLQLTGNSEIPLSSRALDLSQHGSHDTPKRGKTREENALLRDPSPFLLFWGHPMPELMTSWTLTIAG